MEDFIAIIPAISNRVLKSDKKTQLIDYKIKKSRLIS